MKNEKRTNKTREAQRKYESEKIIQVSLKFRKNNADEMELLEMMKEYGIKNITMALYHHYKQDKKLMEEIDRIVEEIEAERIARETDPGEIPENLKIELENEERDPLDFGDEMDWNEDDYSRYYPDGTTED